MEAGTHVWCRDTKGDEAWILLEVIEKIEKSLELFSVKDHQISPIQTTTRTVRLLRDLLH